MFLAFSAFCGGSFYVEVELNRDIDEIKDTASSAEIIIDSINSQVSWSDSV